MKEQRVIKFRAWDKESACMRDVVEINFKSKHFDLMLSDPTPSAPDNWVLRKFDDAIIMSFTGLLDKAGNEIYEGDIRREEIENDDGDEVYYCVMTYITEWSMFAWLSVTHGEYDAYLSKGAEVLDTVMYWSYPAGQEDQNKVTVCGNLHQHKHLIE
jgi:uncharacterized phage protein (TIGR01671 family)